MPPLPHPEQRQRVLFYLPMVTNWWFVHIVEPLIRRVASGHEVHILAPAPWRGTGIGADELARCADLAEVRWYIMDGADHPSTRTVPEDAEGLIGFVRDLAPDFVLCRTADFDTVRHFPGIVRLLMEGRFEPFAPPPRWILLADRPHDYGALAPLAPAEEARLDAMLAPAWHRLQQRLAPPPDERLALFARLGIPADRPLVLLPLECEMDDNFFLAHRLSPRPNAALVRHVSAQLGDRFTLAVTNHPLNDAHVDAGPLIEAIGDCDNAVLLPPAIGPLAATLAIARHADGMLVGDSKTFALAAFFGVPIHRHSQFASGSWLNAYAELPPFLADIAAGTARRPDPELARRWFAQYLLNDAVDPLDADDDLLARLRCPVGPERWDRALTRLERTLPALFGAEGPTPPGRTE
ncbi:hypothetical protein ACNFJ7_15615 [Sphingomonas sp. HT-1]|uniref:hypothetical protein n=1 Tax=unclassified Sphingomonas TaxID=196159 RepID=UPI00030AC249|nr:MULTISPECIES: hypothetical protein [unclassified Sphingomonas]KTF70807.1 hypothetical protein ATB93_00390 [Sphingomonas sp. WG]